ncbi:HU family DNA-binding protein [Pontitalea aquivivens]|uniref:HU family DNA-binding protein n=1 Tax=Pontitalea aquivivens TaxID=3388663 RepID=UPI0039705C15
MVKSSTKSATKSAPRTTAARKAASAPQPAAEPIPESIPATTVADKPAAPVLRKKDFLDRVIAESGARKPDARSIAEATLKVLGEALARGEALSLPPLGKLRVSRSTPDAGGARIVVKLRRGVPATDLAEVPAGRSEKAQISLPGGLAEGDD